MISARNLRNKIVFNSITENENEYGEKTESLTPVLTLMSEISDSEISQDQTAEGNSIGSFKTFRIRFHSGVNASMIITFKGENYEIASINNVKELNRVLEINAVNYIKD